MKKKDFKSSLINEIGATMIEYVLMLALICVVAIASAKAAGEETYYTFNEVQRTIATAGKDIEPGSGGSGGSGPPPPPPP